MEHSLYSYLTRRSGEELEHILTMLQAGAGDDYEAQIVDMAAEILESRNRSACGTDDKK